MLSRLRNLSERGDTIVEVAISIAVISLVIVGAYVVSNTSLGGTTLAQERLNATKLAESQLEQLDEYASNDATNTVFSQTKPFCLTTVPLPPTPPTPPAPPRIVSPVAPTYCTISSIDSIATVPFSLSISPPSSADTFIATVNWTGPAGAAEQLQIAYRIHPYESF